MSAAGGTCGVFLAKQLFNRDYHAETPEGEQMPMLDVFVRDGDRFRHTWGSELMYAPRDEGLEARHVDSIWPIWNVPDVTPEGRGNESTSRHCATTEQ